MKKQRKNKKMRIKLFFTISFTLILFSVIVTVLFIIFIRHYSVEQTYKRLTDSQWLSVVSYSGNQNKRFVYSETPRGLMFAPNQYNISQIMIVSEEELNFPIGLNEIVTESFFDVLDINVSSTYDGYHLNDIAAEYFTENPLKNFNLFMKNIFFSKNIFSSNIVNTMRIVEYEISRQEEESKRYSFDLDDKVLYFRITKTVYNNRWFYVVSYLQDDYSEYLIESISVMFFPILSLAIVFGLILAAIIANNITKPLSELEKKVLQISEHKWNEPVSVKSKDEIGRLADSVEQMRANLVKRDENQQAFLQYISHELKTPIATAKSYTEAIRDQIYPKGTLEDSLEVIDDQFEQIEKRVNDLLNLTKTEYISENKNRFKQDGFTEFIREFMLGAEKAYPKFDWSIHIEAVKTYFAYEAEMFEVMMDNLISNQIRYAQKKIAFKLIAHANSFELIFENDGPQIDEKDLGTIFEPFHKGTRGINGLGLNIVKRIVTAHDGQIKAENLPNGVRFIISF
jgi:two-component system sensor histidine kinase CssS